MTRFAEVAVDAPSGYARTFSYSIPPSMSVRTGHLVQVPFGPRRLRGIVFSLPSVPQVPETRDILEITSPEPALTETQLSLARWLSSYYMCSLFGAAALMLPPGGPGRSRTYFSLKPGSVDSAAPPLTHSQEKVLEYVRARGTVEQQRLLNALGEGAAPTLRRLVERGIILRSLRPGRAPLGPKYVSYLRLTSQGQQALAGDISEIVRHAPRQAACMAVLAMAEAPLPMAEARKSYGAGAVRRLLERGWVQEASVAIERDPLAGKVFPVAPAVTLTPHQTKAAAEIRGALDNAEAEPRVFLLQGVTGSGKTEVYLDAAEHCLSKGRKAIVLVPEIVLTHQTVERFAARFPGQVAVLHSRLSAGEQFDQWWKVHSGAYGVVIGSRSAIFAPQPDLGLVIIDEEHEWTYKQQDASPRYHARDVAVQLASRTGAAVVLGSASPDLASYYRALRQDFRLLTLPERVAVLSHNTLDRPGPTSMASVQVVDMRQELREGNSGIFSRTLVAAMGECLDAGNQMVLFLNRRGSARYTQCRSCGFSLRCSRCDIPLSYHSQIGRLMCHYCGYRRLVPAKCPKCLSYRLSSYGVGTQAVVEEVTKHFPGIQALRLDSDVMTTDPASEKVLERFGRQETPVLVGTQMVAKGLHFPSVSLVGVVSADAGLNIPDYRAGERAFQLLCQVAGRAGRGLTPGRVIIQTYQPGNYSVQAAASQDYQEFYHKEMQFRREQGNPPLNSLVRLLYAHTNRALCEREASRLAALFRREQELGDSAEVEVLGPTPAYPPRLRGHYRWHLVLRGPSPRTLVEKVAIPAGWVVDVDPVALT